MAKLRPIKSIVSALLLSVLGGGVVGCGYELPSFKLLPKSINSSSKKSDESSEATDHTSNEKSSSLFQSSIRLTPPAKEDLLKLSQNLPDEQTDNPQDRKSVV